MNDITIKINSADKIVGVMEEYRLDAKFVTGAPGKIS